MAQRNWSTNTQNRPPVSWNQDEKTFSIVLHGLEGPEGADTLEAQWKPPRTYVVRIREANGGSWSLGFETPLTGCGFVDLAPDTEYEVEIRPKDAGEEGDPIRMKINRDPEGDLPA
jgi:hypothetical protein